MNTSDHLDFLPRLKEIQASKASRRLLAVLIFIAVVAYFSIVELVFGQMPLF